MGKELIFQTLRHEKSRRDSFGCRLQASTLVN